MKMDMGGAAAALGTFWALTHTGFEYPLECWLAVAENNCGTRSAMRTWNVLFLTHPPPHTHIDTPFLSSFLTCPFLQP
jgi:hypothetical protein